MKYKTGDKVRCVSTVGLGGSLNIGEIYTIVNVLPDKNEALIYLKGGDSWYFHHFFKVINEESAQEKPVFKTGDIVRCINVEGPFGHLLQLGNIYTIDEVYESSVMVWGVINCLFEPNRFERIICPCCKKGIQITPNHQKESEEDV